MLKRNRIVFLLGLLCLQSCGIYKGNNKKVADYSAEGYDLVWADEFTKDGIPDAKNWTYEKGFVRNEELQWYQPENAFCKDGLLIIEARKEQRANPLFVVGSKDWRKQRENIEYTSSCLISRGLQSWQYGRFEMRGKIDISEGLWPAFWTLGEHGRWPANGEIDIMEYYKGKILSNIARMGTNSKPKWFSTTKEVNKAWAKQFHTWRMDWDNENISLFVDDTLYLNVPLTELQNEGSQGVHPFKQKHYLLLDLAMGGLNGGNLAKTKFPNRMEVDYVRVYQKK
ncbi:glycoside hydrolase family 16 protein [Pedobacter sp. Du54]|uniref:glycoside hydrolase family 16 protein n=1 Tax=Pedobacter anseongensis TaxID=3133439 RepID=UPI0030B4E9E0